MRITKRTFISAALAGAIAVTIFTGSATQRARAQAAAGIPPAITTPDKVETRIGTLEFKDGMPDKASVETLYHNPTNNR
jgi:hypothetical protein